MVYVLSGYGGKTIEAIALNMRSNQSAGAGHMYVKIGNKEVAKIPQ
jgi:hypothetical protein